MGLTNAVRRHGSKWVILGSTAAWALAAGAAWGQAAPNTPVRITANSTSPTVVSEVVVTASKADLLGVATTASQGTITAEEVKLRPAYRPGQLLESIPGLVVTLHSGEGKAPQYLVRGFNLDHGTDIANFIDDVPINRPTNAHGQGYADLNFIIPETVGSIDFTKGTFYPAIGDFGAVASDHQHLLNEIPNQVSLSVGTLADDKAFIGGTHRLGADDRVTGGIEYVHVDGPYTHSDNFQKYAALLRYSHGVESDGYSLTGMYYHGAGNFTTDQPLRAQQEGLIGRYGSLDPSDRTINERLSLSGVYAAHGDWWRFKTNAYYVHSKQTLWNDFTHFLLDPVNGDQEQQDETRNLAGGGAALTLIHGLGPFASETTFGVQGRYDSVFVDRRHTKARKVLNFCEALQLTGPAIPYSIGNLECTADQVQLGDEALYVENSTHFASWLRTDIGAREEFYQVHDRSETTGFDGSKAVTLLQPKGSLTIGPWQRTELYFSAGRGFHSDDARGVLQPVAIEGLPTAVGAATPLLVKADAEEIGLRTDLIPRVHLQVAVFNTDLQSELVYDQDQGQDQAGAPSNRKGVEVSAQYRVRPWLELNADASFSRARFTVHNLADYGQVGAYIPNAPNFIGSLGALVDNLGPWFGSLQVRALGSYPLISDNSARDAGYTETNLNVGYKLGPHLVLAAEVFNLFAVRANASSYYYVTRLPGEPADGIQDHQPHPLEPISARFTMTATF